jgi:hypothetical protein
MTEPSRGEPLTTDAQEVSYEPKLVTARTSVEILLDASGSMAAPFGATSQSKFDIVRQAVDDVILGMREQQTDFPRNLGLRLFGSTTEAQAANCEDTERILPLGEPNFDQTRKVLDEAHARGMSPIAFALAKTLDDFPGGMPGDRTIVLIADGGDTCEGDPCAAAARIATAPAKTSVNVVAFDVTSEEQERLACIARLTDGKMFFARTEEELRSGIDQAVNSTLPYNLKLTAQAAGTTLPFRVVVYRAGTEEVVKRGESLGTKLLSLPPGTYDILIEYDRSSEERKPSKILKGVEILASTRVEQTIVFTLGQVMLSAVSSEGTLAPSRFKISKAGTDEVVATVEVGAEAKTLYLSPGTYDITTTLLEAEPESFNVTERGVTVSETASMDLTFRFQKGSLAMKGVTTQQTPLPFIFQTFASGTESLVASGALPAEGGSIELPPGTYDLLVIGQDPAIAASPRTKITGVIIKAGETTALAAIFELGVITLSAVDGKANKLPAEFVLFDQESKAEMARASSPSGLPIQVSVPPGTYDIQAFSTKSILEPKPSTTETNVTITAQQPIEQVIQFVLGTLRLRGRNAKEQPVRTQFTIFPAGGDVAIAQAPPSSDWMVFELTPGTFDVLAAETTTGENTGAMIWIRDVTVEDGKTLSHEAIFTAGKIKIIGRGPNNRVIPCHFKVFKYGMDRELLNGETGNDWDIFEIEPGKYYVEASFHDEQQSVMLKKWINVNIGENEVVELVLRF